MRKFDPFRFEIRPTFGNIAGHEDSEIALFKICKSFLLRLPINVNRRVHLLMFSSIRLAFTSLKSFFGIRAKFKFQWIWSDFAQLSANIYRHGSNVETRGG